jgi:hypothetical protein
MIDDEYGASVEWVLAGETEVLGENLPQRHFVHHHGGKPATNRLSYGTAFVRNKSAFRFLQQVWKKIKLRGFSPQANYTDRTTAACRRN